MSCVTTIHCVGTAGHKLAENCGFGLLKEELIRDRTVVGIRDKGLSEQLQMESDLKLAKAIQRKSDK